MDSSGIASSDRSRVRLHRRNGSVRSLRSRWRRSFALLTAVVMLSGTAGIVGTLLVVDHFRGSAVAVEQEATASDALRNEIVAWAIIFSSPITATQQTQEAAAAASIRADYAADLGKMKSAAARALLATSLAKWTALHAAGGPAGHPTGSDIRGGAAATQAPAVLSILDQAGSVNRAAIRVDLARQSRLDREGFAVLII